MAINNDESLSLQIRNRKNVSVSDRLIHFHFPTMLSSYTETVVKGLFTQTDRDGQKISLLVTLQFPVNLCLHSRYFSLRVQGGGAGAAASDEPGQEGEGERQGGASSASCQGASEASFPLNCCARGSFPPLQSPHDQAVLSQANQVIQ